MLSKLWSNYMSHIPYIQLHKYCSINKTDGENTMRAPPEARKFFTIAHIYKGTPGMSREIPLDLAKHPKYKNKVNQSDSNYTGKPIK